jgi:hypothetical protein
MSKSKHLLMHKGVGKGGVEYFEFKLVNETFEGKFGFLIGRTNSSRASSNRSMG